MARTPKDTRLDNRTARLKLEAGKRHWQKIAPGLSLGYRRPQTGSGSWTARIKLDDGREPWIGLGVADDFEDAGAGVLDHARAVDAARESAQRERQPDHKIQAPMTVGEVLADYLKHYQERGGKALRDTEYAVNSHILPHLANVQVSDLTPGLLKTWQDKLAKSPPRLRAKKGEAGKQNPDWKPTPENIRARQATVNRVRTVLIAALNHGYQSGCIADDSAWRKTKPFKNADKPVVQFLSPDDCVRLLNACPEDFRLLVKGALLTGARYGELVRLKAGDVQLNNGGLWLHETKASKPRFIHLNAEGAQLFETLTVGKDHAHRVFTKDDGGAWGDSHQTRRFSEALTRAGLPGHFSFHDLRHSFASLLIQAGASIEVIADLLGHADTRVTLRHYAHLADSVRREAVARLPSFGLEQDNKIVRLRAG